MVEYPSVIAEGDRLRLFYCGNGYGQTGIGTALSAPPGTGAAGRPVVALSLAVDYAIHGLEVEGWHTTNILVHVLAALALFGLVRQTLRLARTRGALVPAATPGVPLTAAWTSSPRPR